jgi:phage shock protein PspC (stress-responsive transcriptional regulator)
VKQVYISETNRKIAGVCGGIGEYFEIDPVLIRVLFLILFFGLGGGLIIYIICWIIFPQKAEIV